MRYFWCWLFPPLGLVTCGKPGLAFVNFLLCCTIVGIPFAVLWSFLVARDFYADRRHREFIDALNDSRGANSRRRGPAGRASSPLDSRRQRSRDEEDELDDGEELEDEDEVESEDNEEPSSENSHHLRNALIGGCFVGLFVCAIGFVAVMVAMKSTLKREPEQPVVASVAETQPPTPPLPTTSPVAPTRPVKRPKGEGESLTAPDLVSRFLNDQESAMGYFDGAKLTITGTVAAPANAYPNGEVRFKLFTFREGNPSVWCHMAISPKVVAARFPVGMEVTVRGRCNMVGAGNGKGGMVAGNYGLSLFDCELIGDPLPAAADYPKAITQGGIEFRITAAQLGQPIIVLSDGRNSGAMAQTKEKYLIFRLQVWNTRPADSDKMGPLAYKPPRAAEVQLVDEHGNKFEYGRLGVLPEPKSPIAKEFTDEGKPSWRFQNESAAMALEPGQTGTYFLVFSPSELGKGKKLFLKLPSPAMIVPRQPAQVFWFEQKAVEILPEVFSSMPTPMVVIPPKTSDAVLEAKLTALTTQLAKGKTAADRIKAADELLKLGAKAKVATGALCQAIFDPAPQVRVAALDAMKAVNPDVYGPVATITTPLTDADLLFLGSTGRPEAVATLAKLGAEGRPAVPILIAYKRLICRPGGWQFVAQVVDALASLAPDDPMVISTLATGLLKDADANARFAAANGLAGTKATKESVVALGTAVRSDPAPEIRLAAVKALASMGGDAKAALKSLEAAKSDGDAQVREAAREAIEKVK